MGDEDRAQLIERLEAAKRDLEEFDEVQPQPQPEPEPELEPEPPRDPELAFAEAFRDALNQSRSPWIHLEGGRDAA
jgi:hypothetical protein